MGQPQARVGDIVLCALFAPTPAGPVPGPTPLMPPCAVTVLVGKMPAARMTDLHIGIGPHPMLKCSTSVIISYLPAARLGDTAGCGGAIIKGEFTVLTGG